MTVVPLGRGPAPDGIGGKGASWWRFHALGVRVPDGFVVLRGRELESDALEAALESLAKRCGCTEVAVRSSGLAEDGAAQSLAGLYESVLDVPLAATTVRGAVERCRRAAQSDRARLAGGAREMITVLVQEMVRPTWSGLLFTRDPRGRHRSPVIELVNGHLRELVDGVRPAHQLTLDAAGWEALRAIVGETADSLASLARTVEAEFGPSDIEWAVTEAGVVLLQARPITALPRPRRLGTEILSVDHAHATQMPHEVRQHDKVLLRLLAERLDIPISRGYVAICMEPGADDVNVLAKHVEGWGEMILVLLSPFHWKGQILRRFATGPTAADELRAFVAELGDHLGWFALLLKELQPTARTGIATLLPDGRVLAEVVLGHFVTKGIADASSYFLNAAGGLQSARLGQQTMKTLVEHGRTAQVGVDEPPRLTDDELAQIFTVVTRLAPHHPGAGIEFGYTPANDFFLVDLYEKTTVAPTSARHDVLCEGRIVGRVRIADVKQSAVEESIERHVHDTRETLGDGGEEPEIVVLPRPYHHMDRLVYAARPGMLGIVCEEGSLLCHLAVVMREKGVPGLLLRDVRSIVTEGDRAILDTRQGSSVMLRRV